jgi:hypothetical protein
MYFITPNYSVVENYKCGSSTLARAIIKEFYPTEENSIQKAAYPPDKSPNNVQWHFLCPKEKEPSKQVLIVVRNPVQRFLSALGQFNLTDVDEVLYALENKTLIAFPRKNVKVAENNHFTFQSDKILSSALCYKMSDLNLAAEEIGLTLPLPVINEAGGIKPQLTQEQTARIEQYYAKDMALYNSIPNGGGLINK